MLHRLIHMAAVGVCLATGLTASAQQPGRAEGPRVVITTTRSVHLEADGAVLSFHVSTSVEGVDKSATDALELKIGEVKKALQAVPVDNTPVDIRVSPPILSTTQSNPANPGTPPSIHGKKAKSAFQVTVREKDANKLRTIVAKLSEAAVENGGTSSTESGGSPFKLPRNVAVAIGGGGDDSENMKGPAVLWLSSNSAQARRDAIRQAVKDATADAEAACGKNVAIQQIEVTDKDSDKDKPAEINFNTMMRMTYGGESEATPNMGVVKLIIEVRVTCSY